MTNEKYGTESAMEILSRWSLNPVVLIASAILMALLAGINIGIAYLAYELGLGVEPLEILVIIVFSALCTFLTGLSLIMAKNMNKTFEKTRNIRRGE